jgi:hypothetical protein
MVEDAMTAGCIGISLGRNIFQHRRPDLMTAALRAIIVERATVQEAADILKGEIEMALIRHAVATASR